MGNSNDNVCDNGTFRGFAKGKYGDVAVDVKLDSGALTSVKVVEHHENINYASLALDYIPLKIVEEQSLDIDVVSGATYTSKAIIEAVKDAIDGCDSEVSESLNALCQKHTGQPLIQHMKPGVYRAKAQGKWAPKTIDGARFKADPNPELLEVEVRVTEDAIEDVKLIKCTDNDHFVKPVVEKMIPSIIENQSVMVDVVTGSTCTSAAVLKATTDCLKQAGADIRGFLNTPPRSNEEIFEECDVCVVGAGHAGTVAALMALEKGATVLLLEKAGRLGGRGFCPSGVSAAGAQIEKDAGITLTADDLYRQLYEETGGRANNLLIKAVAEDSGPMVDWLIEHGFHGTPPKPNSNPDEQFMCDFGRGQEKFDALYENYILPMGGKIMLETSAYDLVMEDGKVVGVEAVRKDGTKVHIKCKAAIVGTGGFSGNPDLMKRLCYSNNFYERGLTTQCAGDGILMAEKVGAQLGPEIMPHMQEYAANAVCNFTDNLIKYITYGGFLTVNLEGKRFMNECLNVEDAMGSGCASLRVQGGAYYYIIDQNQVDIIQEKGIDGYFDGKLGEYLTQSVASRALVPIETLQESLDDAIAKGQAWKATSPEELAEAIGFADPSIFVETFNRYNEMCRNKNDEDFGKISQMMNEHVAPIYAIKSCIPIMGTLGGVKVNERLEALNGDDEAIPGLYIVGQEGSGFYTYPYYSTRCATTTYAYCSGRLAGKYAAEYIKNR